MKICSVLSWDDDGQNNVLVHKHEETDFNCLTQLIVHENQEAIFFMNGQALDSFGPGRYTLETQNIPLITKLLNRLTGDKNPFHCEVYYVNKTEQMGIKWGTDSKIQYIEPKYGFPLEIGMSGEMSISVDNARKLIIKLVGTDNELTNEKFISYLRSILNSKVKPYVAKYMKENAVSIFEIDEHLEAFSDNLKSKLAVDFDDYGLALNRFNVSNIAKPEESKEYREFKQLHFDQYAKIARANLEQQEAIIRANTEAQKTVIISKAEATKRIQEGYTYQQERGFDVAEDAAKNEAVGQFANLGVGLGTAAGVGGTIGGVVGTAVNNVIGSQPITNKFCPTCGATISASAKFCSNCGTKVEMDNKVVCPNCGKLTRVGKFCEECGNSLEGDK